MKEFAEKRSMATRYRRDRFAESNINTNTEARPLYLPTSRSTIGNSTVRTGVSPRSQKSKIVIRDGVMQEVELGDMHLPMLGSTKAGEKRRNLTNLQMRQYKRSQIVYRDSDGSSLGIRAQFNKPRQSMD